MATNEKENVILQASKSNLQCVLAEDIISKISENLKQFIISIENEAEISHNGLNETRDILIKEIQENFSHISYIRQVCIESHYHISHSINVSAMAILIGIKIGLRAESLKVLGLAGLVHDLGKIKIPYQVLLKGGKMTSKERELYKLHVPLGYKMAKDELKFDPLICRVILEHHERNDSSGYPRGLATQDLHLYSQIIAVVDNFDMLMNKSLNVRINTVSEVIKEMLSENHKYNPQALHTLAHMIRYNSR